MASNADKIPAFSLPQTPSAPVPATRPAGETGPKTSPASEPALEADFRLVIDEDPVSGTFIYKTVDRATGQVVHQLPREELLRLRDDPAYTTGSVLKTRV